MWQSRFNPLVSILFFFIALFVYTKLAGPIPFSVNSVNTNKTDAFVVSGEGTSVAKPDMAILNVGVSANGSTVKSAQDQINININKVTSALKNLGISPDDIKTVNYFVNPNTDYNGGNQNITGYSASTNIMIQIRKLEEANAVIDAATAAGANQIGGLTFDVSDKSKAENEARQMAVAQAKKKAEDAARIAGFTLGRIVNYSENLPADRSPMPLLAVGAVNAPTNTTQVEPGNSEIKVTVTLSYEIR